MQDAIALRWRCIFERSAASRKSIDVGLSPAYDTRRISWHCRALGRRDT